MNFKTIGIQYKDEGNGSIEGYASTWVKEPDSYGDICREGCFKNSLENRWNGGKNIPLLWAHKMDDINAYVGTATAQEDETGLFFHADFNGSPEAEKIRGLYKSGTLTSFSFAYDIIDEGTVTLEDGRKANELRELDIFEISCVLVPANSTATVTEVKSEEPKTETTIATATVKIVPELDEKAFNEVLEKAGRRNRKSDEDIINQIISLAQSLLDDVDDTEDDASAEDRPKDNAEIEAKDQTVDNALKQRLLETINAIEKEVNK